MAHTLLYYRKGFYYPTYNEKELVMENNKLPQSYSDLKASTNSKSVNHNALYSTAAIAAALFPVSNANATLIVNNSSFTVENNSSVDWDIDGDGDTDINLFDDTSCHTDSINSTIYRLNNTQNGLPAFLYSGDEVVPITSSTIVGPAGNFNDLSCALHERTCNSSSDNVFDFNLFQDSESDTDFGGFFGFRFDNNGITNYGIAGISFSSFDGVEPIGTANIRGWVYEDSGASIDGSARNLINTVPVPPSLTLFGAGLALLAMGSSGTRRRRTVN